MNREASIIYIISFVLVSVIGTAQTNDAGLWSGFSLEKKLNQSLSIELVHETRFNENITEIGRAHV